MVQQMTSSMHGNFFHSLCKDFHIYLQKKFDIQKNDPNESNLPRAIGNFILH